MGKSLADLATELKDERLPTAGQQLDDLPIFGSFAPPPPPGAYRFKLPMNMSSIWELFEVDSKGQRVKAIFDRDHPLLIVQSPKNASNGEPFETRMNNNERKRNKDGTIIASDFDYLLRALGERAKPKSNREYVQLLQNHAGHEFSADLKYRWICNAEKDIRVKDPQGQYQVVEGRKGCGEVIYQDDVPTQNGVVPYEITCGGCKMATLRAWANLENIRA